MSLTSRILIKNGPKVNLPTLSSGELGYCNDAKELYMGNGGANDFIGSEAATNHLKDYIKNRGYAETAGTSTLYTATLSPVPVSLSSGFSISIKPHIECGDEPWLQINAFTELVLKQGDGNTFLAGDLKTDQIYSFRKIGTELILESTTDLSIYTSAPGSIGYTGSQGSTGYAGSVGFQGSQGSIGYTGSQGNDGSLGYSGSQGIQGELGYTGSQGIQGEIGVTGYTGSEGIQGTKGYTGSKGDQGNLGYTGSQGIKGDTGYVGSQGIEGPIGYVGSQGIEGPTGYTGSQGIQGSIGYVGSEGIQGLRGYTGSQGIQGNLGYTGSKGDIGYTGSQGVQGDTGYVGSEGIQGDLGYTGSQGIQGNLGYTGSQGNLGYTGSQGIQGDTGYVGSEGIQGDLGYTGSQGIQGDTGYVGSKGDTGYVGSHGSDGSQGYTGSAGSYGYTPVNKNGDTLTGFLTLHADPSNNLHAVTKQYADAIAAGIKPKASVKAATTEEITLTGIKTIDTVLLSVDDRVLVKDQSTATNNGIYLVKTTGWIRTEDADGTPVGEVTSGMNVFVEDGDINKHTSWVLVTSDVIEVGVSNLVFSLYAVSGQLIAGSGLSKTGETLAVNLGQGLDVLNDNLIVKLDGTTLTKGDNGLKVTDTTFAPYSHGHGADDVSLVTSGFSKNLDSNVDDVQKLAAAVDGLGVVGYTGSQGNLGYTGSQGNLGYTGSKGDIGYTGSQGIQGETGYTGSQGIQGEIGYTGSQGIQGYTGSQGIQGNLGYTGSQGIQGNLGYTGSQGDTGYVGSQGIEGELGYTGSQGIQGSIGYTGSQGIQGNLGYTGSQGIQGSIGYTGSQGIQGIQGYTGSQGIQGDVGYTGSQGIQGDIGYTGSQGLQGDLGYTGSQGVQGDLGYTGSQGTDGTTGYVGSRGDLGYTGSAGSFGYTPVNKAGDTMSGNLTAPQLVSNVAIGTAPLTVTSTTRVDNLNADMLNGSHLHELGVLSVYKTSKDSNGIFVQLDYKRSDATLFMSSTLSGGTSPTYTTRTEVYYDTNGSTVLATKVYTLSYDVASVLTSEVLT